MQKNDVLTLSVEGFGAEAEGVCRHEGRVIFVPGALPGEQIQALIVKTLKSHAFGKLISVLESSPHRVEPPCPYYAKCGGCSCQHMGYEAELNFKRNYIQDALSRIGGLDIHVPPVMGMANPWHYRNKTSLPVSLQDGIPVSGFYMRRSHQIIPTKACLIAKPQSDIAGLAVTEWMREYSIAPYNELSHNGLVRHIMTRISRLGEVMVVLVINGQEITHQQALLDILQARLPGLASLCVSSNTKRGNTIMGSDYRVLWGKERLEDRLCGYSYQLSPLSFFQVNADQAERLYLQALALAAPRPDDLVVDLYCGAGTISTLFASHCREVIGIEIVPQTVTDARQNAARNGISNLRFLEGEAERLMPQLVAEEGQRPNIVVLDPPRKGTEETVLRAICDAAPRSVVYISCHPGTQARDARYLCQRGYFASVCSPFDMFCHTADVENILLFERREER